MGVLRAGRAAARVAGMALQGILRTWHDDRGYGFIAPRNGGREIFVHVSAFPRDGSRPTVGESLEYELGTGQDGKPQAVRVVRTALGRPQQYPPAPSPHPGPSPLAPVRQRERPSPVPWVIGMVLVLGAAAYGIHRHWPTRVRAMPPAAVQAAVPVPAPAVPAFHCDGRTHCSQMTSCEEATYFLHHCPGVRMDGNRDGVPCEQQWCGR